MLNRQDMLLNFKVMLYPEMQITVHFQLLSTKGLGITMILLRTDR
jgi:hypothetical protein